MENLYDTLHTCQWLLARTVRDVNKAPMLHEQPLEVYNTGSLGTLQVIRKPSQSIASQYKPQQKTPREACAGYLLR